MSTKAVQAVLDADFSDIYTKMLLVCLANAFNGETGECYPSIKRLATESGMGQTTVRDRLAALQADGLIEIVENFDPATGRQLSHSYRLLFLAGEGSPGEGYGGFARRGGRVRTARGTEGSPGEGGRVRPAKGGGFALAKPSKESTGISIKKSAQAGEAPTRSVSSIEAPELFAECVATARDVPANDRQGGVVLSSADRRRGNCKPSAWCCWCGCRGFRERAQAMSFEDTNQAATMAADSMFGELRFMDAAIGMLHELSLISAELGDGEVEAEARAVLAFAALAKALAGAARHVRAEHPGVVANFRQRLGTGAGDFVRNTG